MKKLLSIMAMVLLAAAGAIGQSPAPGIFNYQGVARNSVGNVLINKTITLRLTVHDGTAVGPTVYQESRTVTTNPFGLFNVQVGSPGASNVTGTVAGVNWGVGNKYIQVEIDPNGGSTFINIGTAQIASVPYSLYSSLANDLVLPFVKTQSNGGPLFNLTNSGTGSAIVGNGTSGAGIVGTSSTGNAAQFTNSNAANTASTVLVNSNATTGVGLQVNKTGTGQMTAVYGNINTTAGASTAIGGADFSSGGASPIEARTYGILGQTGTTGIAVGGYALNGGTALRGSGGGATGYALNTSGRVQLAGIGEANNYMLRSDITGNATWVDPTILLGSLFWSTTGNAGTNPAVNFIGTTDNNDVVLKRNNIKSGLINTTNTSFGFNALNPANTGFSNTANGASALRSNTTGNDNTAIGAVSLFSNTTGSSNTAMGTEALRSNTTGSDNTANGFQALHSNTTGFNNTANGYQALLNNTTGAANTASGMEALRSNTTGNQNTANGYQALYSNTTGENNTATGRQALRTNTTGIANTATGFIALFSNTTGNANTATGGGALTYNTTGSANTANGASALGSNTSGSDNTATGSSSLFANTTGFGNAAIGKDALRLNTTGALNTAIGMLSLTSNNGSSNTATGYEALRSNSVGVQNTATGVSALYSNTTGSSNTASGLQALYLNTTGLSNSAFGGLALGANTTGSNNTGIGYNAQVPVAAGNNQVRIGNTSVTYAGVEVAWTITSDKRMKSDIKTAELGLDFIKTLNPVSYHRSNDESKKTEYGFIAQEVEEALNRAGAKNTGIITKDDAGKYGMRYNDLIAPMVKAIQQQQALIEEQQGTIEQLKSRLAALEKKVTQ